MTAVDPIVGDIIMHHLCAIPNLIDKDITRTAFSFLISEYKDYATGIVDADGRLIAQCTGGLPIFCANALCAAVKDGLKLYGKKQLQHGDVVLSNHAATMGQHLNNVVMYTPIRTSEADDGLLGFFVVVMHWMDVGGITPGSCTSNDTTDVFQEGLQLHTVKLLSAGRHVEEIYRIVAANTRFPEMVLGDLESQVAGCVMGRDLTLELIEQYRLEAVRAAIEAFWDKSERATRETIRAFPNGVYRATSFLDDDGRNRGVPVPVNVVVVIADDAVTIDLSDLAPQASGPMNAGYEGGAVAAARIACKYIFSPNEPANDGAFRPIAVVCPEGTFLSARAGAPLGGSGTTIPTVVDTILRALALAAPEHVPAAHHGTYGIHVIDGELPGGGTFMHLESTIGGWGGSAAHDGPGPFRSNAHGDTKEVPVELQEAANPYLIEYVRLRQDSGGAGRNRGGLGVEKCYRLLSPCRLTTTMERTTCAPWGAQGGHSGAPGRIEVERAGEPPIVLNKGTMQLQAGDRILVRTAGGGGYGDPTERTRERIASDLTDRYISAEAAAADYGIL